MNTEGFKPNHISQGYVTVICAKMNPKIMKTIPKTKLRYFLFNKGYSKIIAIPIKCRIPKTMKS